MKQLYADVMRHVLMFAVLFIAFLVWIHASNMEYPQAKNGILDLTEWNLNKEGKITLSGEWAFDWGEFLTREDYKDGFRPEPADHIDVR